MCRLFIGPVRGVSLGLWLLTLGPVLPGWSLPVSPRRHGTESPSPQVAQWPNRRAAALHAQSTRPERTAGAETSSYADVTGFLDSLVVLGAGIHVGILGASPEGKPLPWVLAARPMVDGPGDAQRSGKPIVYIQGNIHAGEVEGKEAAQMILRDLTVGPLRPLLDSVIVLVVPIYNADGNDRFGPGERNRPGQNGPATVGQGGNGQGLNLNRDYVKLEAPETRASLALLNLWQPDLG